jgi:hypothetical protein
MKTTALVALLGVASAAPDRETENEFAQWQAVHGRSYRTSEERAFRINQFARARNYVRQNNSDRSSTHQAALNDFADWTEDEYTRMLGFGGVGAKGSGGGGGKRVKPTPEPVVFPDPKDWRTSNAVSPVKNQGGCGSCWAFASAACMESMWYIKTGTMTNLSEQQWVDCDTGNYGCNGGWMNTAFNYARTNAIASETDYPYNARDNTCNAANVTGIVNTTGYVDVTRYNPAALEAAVRDVGPVTIAVEAGNSSFMYYSSGVISSGCGTRIDHAITLIGYGNDGTRQWWIAKNSWGTGWGESGYVRILKTTDASYGMCGILMYPSYATV